MASSAYEQILKVQALDVSIRQLRHRHAHHETRLAVDKIETRLEAIDVEIASVDAEIAEAQKQQRDLELEVGSIEDKQKGIQAKLYGGEITASKELLALQAEADGLAEKQRAVEDDQLVIMENVELLNERRAEIDQRRSACIAELNEMVGTRNVALAEVDTEIEANEQQRQTEAAPANPELLARYESLRDLYDGVAVARLVNGTCDGCHMQLSAVAVDQLGKMPEDAVVTCEECGRLLVR